MPAPLALVKAWPPAIRAEIRRWLVGAIVGHASPLSPRAMRAWSQFLAALR